MKQVRAAKRRPPVDPAARAWFMIFVLLLLISLVMWIDYNRRVKNSIPDTPIPGRYWGNPDGELHITQFWDLQNPEAIRGEQLVEQYLGKYPDVIFFQTRFFPMDDKSLLITLYAECANQQKKYRPFIKLLFIRQFQWMHLTSVTPILRAIASDAGIDMRQMEACVVSREAISTVSLDRAYGESVLVRTTPTYFVNGTMAEGVSAFEKVMKRWETKFINEQ